MQPKQNESTVSERHPPVAMCLSRNAVFLAMVLISCAWPAQAHAILLGATPTAHQANGRASQ
jgi:hypothetical protein